MSQDTATPEDLQPETDATAPEEPLFRLDDDFLDEEDSLFEHHRIRVDPGQSLIRIDVFLSNVIRNTSRTRVKNACLAGCILVNEKPAKASYKVKGGDLISYLRPHPPAPSAKPENIPVEIIYEDDDFLMLNKKPGMVVHPGVGHWSGTMVHALLYHLNPGKTGEGDEEMNIPYLVHRIDKDTSGILVIAKTELAHNMISKQFFDRTTDRLYYALVWGDVPRTKGVVVGHVGRAAWNRKKFFVYPDGSQGKHAITHYTVLERFGFATLVQCKLETGRTHQIRVHMKYLKHTLFGDNYYDGHQVQARADAPRYDEFIRNCLEIMPRQALHAKTLSFDHPTTGKRMYFDSELPEDFRTVLEKMRKYAETYKTSRYRASASVDAELAYAKEVRDKYLDMVAAQQAEEETWDGSDEG